MAKPQFNFGLKLWSTNLNYFGEAERLYKKGVFQYIELYAVPGSFKPYKDIWKKLKCPYVIHAPHYKNGVNLSDKNNRIKNLELINDSLYCADQLDAKEIILHGGVNGTLDETISQIKGISDSRVLIENKPYFGLEEGQICVGSTPDEISKTIKETGCGFCLDIGHAVYSANSHKIDPLKYITDFLKLSPCIFHLSDGSFKGEIDAHLHFGKGSYPLEQFIKLLPDNSQITIETPKDSSTNLNDFINDTEYLWNITSG